MTFNQSKTREQIREEMSRKGISYADLARQLNQDRQTIYLVLNTNNPCRFGKSHKAAVALGLKEGEVCDD